MDSSSKLIPVISQIQFPAVVPLGLVGCGLWAVGRGSLLVPGSHPQVLVPTWPSHVCPYMTMKECSGVSSYKDTKPMGSRLPLNLKYLHKGPVYLPTPKKVI